MQRAARTRALKRRVAARRGPRYSSARRPHKGKVFRKVIFLRKKPEKKQVQAKKPLITIRLRNPQKRSTKTVRVSKERLDIFYVYDREKKLWYKKHRAYTRHELSFDDFNKEVEKGIHRQYFVHAIYFAYIYGAMLGEFSATGYFYDSRALDSGLDSCERQVYAQVRNRFGFATNTELELVHYDVGFRREYVLDEHGRFRRWLDQYNEEKR